MVASTTPSYSSSKSPPDGTGSTGPGVFTRCKNAAMNTVQSANQRIDDMPPSQKALAGAGLMGIGYLYALASAGGSRMDPAELSGLDPDIIADAIESTNGPMIKPNVPDVAPSMMDWMPMVTIAGVGITGLCALKWLVWPSKSLKDLDSGTKEVHETQEDLWAQLYNSRFHYDVVDTLKGQTLDRKMMRWKTLALIDRELDKVNYSNSYDIWEKISDIDFFAESAIEQLKKIPVKYTKADENHEIITCSEQLFLQEYVENFIKSLSILDFSAYENELDVQYHWKEDMSAAHLAAFIEEQGWLNSDQKQCMEGLKNKLSASQVIGVDEISALIKKIIASFKTNQDKAIIGFIRDFIGSITFEEKAQVGGKQSELEKEGLETHKKEQGVEGSLKKSNCINVGGINLTLDDVIELNQYLNF